LIRDAGVVRSMLCGRVRYALRRCHAFGRVNVWMPIVDSVSPMPECLTPDHGSRGLTRSQQFQ
jgi:hypothetical protein